MPAIPPKGRPFPPGTSGNPDGGKRHDPVKKRIKKLTSVELEKILNNLLMIDPKNLDAFQKEDPLLLKTWIASVAATGIKKGDPSALFALLDRLIGKVTDKVQVEQIKPAKVEDMTNEELDQNIKDLTSKLNLEKTNT
jgi:hypothetical protein